MDFNKLQSWYHDLERADQHLGLLYDDIYAKRLELTDTQLNGYYKQVKLIRMEMAQTALNYIQELDLSQYNRGKTGEEVKQLLEKLVNTEQKTSSIQAEQNNCHLLEKILLFIMILRWFIFFFLRLYPFEASTRTLINELADSANEILPYYDDSFTEMARTALSVFIPDFLILQQLVDVYAGLPELAFEPYAAEYDMGRNLLPFVEMSDFSYGDVNPITAARYNITNMPYEQIPSPITSSQNFADGVLSMFNSLRVRFFRWNQSIVVAFAGTQLTRDRWGSVITDVTQLTGYSPIYQYAAGLLRMVLQTNPNSTVYVTGHSLGGGLAQFAAAANAADSGRLRAVIFNPAGLSMPSINNLRLERMQNISAHVWCVCTEYDFVSPIGMQLGETIILPEEWTLNAHSLEEVRRLLESMYPDQPNMMFLWNHAPI